MKKFIFFTPPFATLIALLSLSSQDFDTYRFAIFGFLFAFALTSYNCIHAVFKSSKHGISLDEYLNKSQTSVFSIPAPIDFVFHESRDAMASIGAKTVDSDSNTRRIDASTGWSLNSIGHRISIQLVEKGDQDTEVQIQSRPKGNWGMMDSGKGRDNIEVIKTLLRSNVQ